MSTPTPTPTKLAIPKPPKPFMVTDDDRATMRELIDVRDLETFDAAGRRIAALRDLSKRATAHFKPALEGLKIATDTLRGLRDQIVKRADAAVDEQVQIRHAWKTQEDARQRQLALAREQAAREAQEAVRRAERDALRAQADALALAQPEVAQALQAEAQAVESRPLPPTPTFRAPALKTAGVTDRLLRSAAVDDFQALVVAVLNGECPLDALEPNQTFLNQRARELGALFPQKYPGCRLVETPSTATR